MNYCCLFVAYLWHQMKTVEIMYFPVVLSVLKWSGEEKLGSVRPSRFFCKSVTVYNMQTWLVVQNYVVFSTLRCPQPTRYWMIVYYMVPNQTESAAMLCSTTFFISLRRPTSVTALSSLCFVLKCNETQYYSIYKIQDTRYKKLYLTSVSIQKH